MVRDHSIVSPSLAIAAHSRSPSVSLAQRPARTRRLSLAQRELALSLAQRLGHHHFGSPTSPPRPHTVSLILFLFPNKACTPVCYSRSQSQLLGVNRVRTPTAAPQDRGPSVFTALLLRRKYLHSGVAETADENPSTEQRRILGALSAAGTTKARTGAEWYTKKKVR